MPTPGPTVIGAPLVQGTMLEYLGFHLSFAHRAEAVPSDPLGDTVVCGHTHMPFVRLAHGRLVIKPGSIGMPYGRTGAHWALLGPGVELRTTHFDIEAAATQLGQDSSTAIRTRTASTEAILRRFTRNASHPTYAAMLEVGRAQKTIFVARYLRLRDLQREIEEGLSLLESH